MVFLKMRLLFLIFVGCFVVLPVSTYSFVVPERLEYELTLGGIKIGSALLETRESPPYTGLYSRVTSVKWVSMFYGIEDGVETLLLKRPQRDPKKPAIFHSHSYKVKMIEGPYRVNKEFLFDRAKKMIVYTDLLNNEKSNHVLKEQTIDPLSGLYHIRQTTLRPGKSVFLNIFNNKLIYRVEVQVLRKEAITTGLGSFNTILVRSNMDLVGDGVFYTPGDIYIWLTDDDMKVPVVIEKRINALVEGKLPDFIKEKMPVYLKEKLSSGSVRAVLVKR